MTPSHRYLRFNLVGLLGFALQLATIAALNHLFPNHYLLTSTAALELTLLYNLAWHIHYTWRDRAHPRSRLRQALRFHLANGLTSLSANLALLPLLVARMHLPVVAANVVTIALCSVANFTLGHRWVFPAPPARTAPHPNT